MINIVGLKTQEKDEEMPIGQIGQTIAYWHHSRPRVTESGNAYHFSSGICPNLVWKT
jgi:hypothetical protein